MRGIGGEKINHLKINHMNTYIVYYRSYTNEGVRIADESITVNAINKNEACKKASQKLDCRHSIQFASLIKGIDNDSVR